MLTNDDAKEVAATILTQLGGRRFIAMTGAKNFVAMNDGLGGLCCSIPQMSGIKVNALKITLNVSDYYDVAFSRLYAGKLTVISEHTDVCFDELQPLFEKETGLLTHL
ncbi:MAG: hypothetical protein H0X02_12360 [Nitrosomonas sp.]|nr:hypothetical protein [Nitrosomonas sp.]